MFSPILTTEQAGSARRWEPLAFADGKEERENSDAARIAEVFEQGRRAGAASSGQMAVAQARQLAALLDSIGSELKNLGDKIARDTLDLAICIARQIVRRELLAHPESVLKVVEEAMTGLPQETQHAQIFLNPEDAKRVELALSGELERMHWRIVEDPRVEAGGCRISATCGDVDATLSTRWAAALAVLGAEPGNDDAH
ncbi:MAG: FliH/SctL family protein [Burkholderiales bacterium]